MIQIRMKTSVIPVLQEIKDLNLGIFCEFAPKSPSLALWNLAEYA